jgi:hypothetical protein
VIDNSRSMLASRAPGGRTRITQARDDAIRIRDQLLDIPSGVATMTDRVLPNLLPVPDRDSFEQTVRQAVQVDDPPPGNDAVTATTLGAGGRNPELLRAVGEAPDRRRATDESQGPSTRIRRQCARHVSLFFIRIDRRVNVLRSQRALSLPTIPIISTKRAVRPGCALQGHFATAISARQ